MKLIKQNKYNGKIVTSILSVVLSFLVLASGCSKQKTEGKVEEEMTNDKNTTQVDPNLDQTTQVEVIKSYEEVCASSLNDIIKNTGFEELELTDEDNKKIDELLKLLDQKDYLNIDCELLRSSVIKPTIVYYEKAAGKKLSSEELAKLINGNNCQFSYSKENFHYTFDVLQGDNVITLRTFVNNLSTNMGLSGHSTIHNYSNLTSNDFSYLYFDSVTGEHITILKDNAYTDKINENDCSFCYTKSFDDTGVWVDLTSITTSTIVDSMLESIEEGRSVSEVLEENKDIISVAAGDKANIIYSKQKTIGTNKK